MKAKKKNDEFNDKATYERYSAWREYNSSDPFSLSLPDTAENYLKYLENTGDIDADLFKEVTGRKKISPVSRTSKNMKRLR